MKKVHLKGDMLPDLKRQNNSKANLTRTLLAWYMKIAINIFHVLN